MFHIQYASDYKGFTFMKFTSQMFSSADESIGQNASATALRLFASDTAHFYVHPYNICGKARAHLYDEEQSF